MGGAFLAAACGPASDPAERPESSGAESSPVRVELLEPGRFSTELPEFATAFSPSGDTVYFNRTPEDRSELDLFVAYREVGGWSEPVLFGPTEGTWAIDPFVSHDGQRLYFSSNAMLEGDPVAEFGIWYTQRTVSGWADPVRLPPPVWSDSSEVYTSTTLDGRLFFSSWRDGVRRMYWTRESGGGWSAPRAITFTDPPDGSNPMVSPDGSFLVFSAAPGPDLAPDLFVACANGAGWNDPRRLPEPINSEYTEFAPAIWGEDLLFTSERPGIHAPVPDSVRPPGDLYRTELRTVALLCGPEEPGDMTNVETLTNYYALRREHDAEGALGLLADDFRIEFAGGPALDKEQAAQSLGWDFGTNGRADWSIVDETPGTIVVEGSETNDFLDLLEIREIPFRSVFHFDRNGLILRQEYAADWEGISVPDALQPAIDWASVNAPEDLERAYPEGRMVYTREAGERWVALLKRWRESLEGAD